MIKEDFLVTAHLAHLDLSEEAVRASLPEFERMLGYFAAMREADTDEAAFGGALPNIPSTRLVSEADGMRQDNANSSPHADALLKGASELEGRYLVVPNVL